MENQWEQEQNVLKKMIDTYGIYKILEIVLDSCSMLDFVDFMNKRAEDFKNEKS